MKAFLVEFDRTTEKASVSSFDDHVLALRILREREKSREAQVEVVLLFAESEDDLLTTHARYFTRARNIVRDLVGQGLNGAHALPTAVS